MKTSPVLAIFLQAWLILALPVESPAQISLIAAPVMEPAGSVGFVGSVEVTFASPRNGTIHYTLDGSTPTARSPEYDQNSREGIIVDRTLTLKAIRRQLGLSSDVASAEFVRARLSAPKAAYGGKVSFYPTVACTLTVSDVPSAVIRYTVDGSAPGPSSPLYAAPLSFAKTTILAAYASAPGYDDGEPAKVTFTLTGPPATPAAVPASQAFATASLAVKVKSSTAGALIRWSIDSAANLENATLLGGDSIVTLLGGKAGDIVTLRAQAFKSGHPPSAMMTEKYTYLPQVHAPVPSRAPGFFYDSAIVALGSATDGAVIRYTLDGTAPTEANSREYTGPINLSETATVRAYAAKPPQPQSQAFAGRYDLRLEKPQISVSSRQYKDSLPVRISSNSEGAILFYTLDGSLPTAQSVQARQIDTIVIAGKDSTALTVIAVKGTVTSDPSREVYVKTAQIAKLAAPLMDPSSREFLDTLRISLRAPESGAVIRYTLDSTQPTASSARYEAPFLLDSTAVVRAKSFPSAGSAGLEAGPDRMERYVLTPSAPIPDPAPGMRFVDSVAVELRTRTRGGVIRYSVGDDIVNPGSSPVYIPGKPILLFRSSLIQAVTVLGTGPEQRVSNIMKAHYEIQAAVPNDTIRPGGTQNLPGKFMFTNAGASPVAAKMSSTEGMGLIGFKDAEAAITLKPVKPGDALRVGYAKPAEQAGSLYRLPDGGPPEFITADNAADLTVPGVYFVGMDTLPPSIGLVSQTVRAGDSTVLTFSVKDNVANPSCDIRSPGLPEGRLIRIPDALRGELIVGLKNPATEAKGLWFRAAAKDFYNTRRLPEDPLGKYYVGQDWKQLATPPILNLGREEYPWDLGGFPLGASIPGTWGQVRKSNPEAGLQALVWSNPRQDYVALQDTSVLTPGMGFWIASASRRSSLTLSPFRAGESQADGAFRMVIRHGWNLVTSPSLDKMYWPVSPADADFPQSLLKGLHAFVPHELDYAESDSLEPWKGYFAYYYGARDTVITLLTDPSKRPASKRSAFLSGSTTPDQVRISLDFGWLIPLRLQARALARDAVASEDEPELPAWRRPFTAWSQRDSQRLKTDVVRFIPGELMHWKVVVADSGPAHAPSRIFRVREGILPSGYQAWAFSSARNMKFRLETNGEVPISGLAEDTLSVYAGPLSKISTVPELQEASVSVSQFAFSLQSGVQGLFLALSIPESVRVDAEIRSLSGRLLAKIASRHLGQGVYRLPLGKGDGAQMGVLQLRLLGEKDIRKFSKKVVW